MGGEPVLRQQRVPLGGRQGAGAYPDSARQCAADFRLPAFRQIVGQQAQLMHAVASAGAQQPRRLLDYFRLVAGRLHREHCFAVYHGGRIAGESGILGAGYQALLPIAFEVAAHQPGGVGIPFNAGVRYRAPRQRRPGGHAQARGELHYIIVGADVQPGQHTAGQRHAPRAQHPLAHLRQQPMAGHPLRGQPLAGRNPIRVSLFHRSPVAALFWESRLAISLYL